MSALVELGMLGTRATHVGATPLAGARGGAGSFSPPSAAAPRPALPDCRPGPRTFFFRFPAMKARANSKHIAKSHTRPEQRDRNDDDLQSYERHRIERDFIKDGRALGQFVRIASAALSPIVVR
jgi:hypothetical protein